MLCSYSSLHPISVRPCFRAWRPPWASPWCRWRLRGLKPTVPLELLGCVWGCLCVWFHHFYQVSRLSQYGHTGILGSGRSPLVRPTEQAGVCICVHV